jgi:hypothetical protein
MPYNLLMPEKEDHRSPQPWWLLVWQRRWWIAVATLFILVWWLVPPLLYRHTGTGKDAKLKAITDTRTALLAGLIGVGALLTFWLNSRVYRITARTLEVTEQGHITDRYTKAIEQLGNDKLDVRLGGIYALERIAVDSKRDHPTVVEVLSAFIREHGQAPTQPGTGTADDGNSEPIAAVFEPPTFEPPTDVQAAVTVLGRLPRRTNVSRGNLIGAHLEGANLGNAHLEGAILIGAHLVLASLFQAHLEEAILGEAHLQFANLSGAHLEGANLGDAHLAGAILSGAHLERANLIGTTVHGLTLEQLDRAILDEETQLPPELDSPTGATPPQPAGEQS